MDFLSANPHLWPNQHGVAPHPVQIAALEKGMDLEGFAYYMEQGLGKSRTTLMDFADKVQRKLATRLVIVCPNSFKGGWLDEIAKWGFDFDAHIYNADDKRSTEKWINSSFTKPPVLIVNFEAIRPKISGRGRSYKITWSDGMYLIGDFIRERKCMLGIDESIQVSTHDVAQTKGALQLTKFFDYVRVLSGKPQKQGPHDLWSQMRIIHHLNGFDYWDFKNAFCKMGGFANKKVIGVQNEDILQERIDPVVFRATKADWTDLPPKLYAIREYQLHQKLRTMYRQMEEEFIIWLREDKAVTIEIALSKYIKLAQIQTGFVYDEDSNIEWLVSPGENTRLKALQEFVEDELVGKAVVVFNHKPVGDLLLETFKDMNPTFIRGGMTTGEVEANKKRFNEDRSCRIIFVTKSAKYGHTLLGNQDVHTDACSTMIFFENTYSDDDRSQLEDRDHRHGQLQESVSYVDFAGTPLDKAMVSSLQAKNNIFNTVFRPLSSKPAAGN